MKAFSNLKNSLISSKKILAVLTVALFFTINLFGQTYTYVWTGATGDDNSMNNDNWDITPALPTGVLVPDDNTVTLIINRLDNGNPYPVFRGNGGYPMKFVEVQIEEGASFTIDENCEISTVNGLTNNGTFICNKNFVIGGTFTNNGTFNNTGSISDAGLLDTGTGNYNKGILNNKGIFNNTGIYNCTNVFNNTGTFNNTDTVNNTGTFLNSRISNDITTGIFSNEETATFNNSGTFDDYGKFNNSGILVIDSDFNLYELLTNEESGSITTSSSADLKIIDSDSNIPYFEDKGDFSTDIKISIIENPDPLITGRADVCFIANQNTTYSEIYINRNDCEISINNKLKAALVKIDNCDMLSFYDEVQTDTLIITAGNDIEFYNEASISNLTGSCTKLTFDDTATITDFAITACTNIAFNGPSYFTDFTVATCNQIQFKDTVQSTSTFNITNSCPTILFGNDSTDIVTFKDFNITSCSALTFSSDVISENFNIASCNTATFNSTVEVTDTFSSSADNANFNFNSSVTADNFSCSGTDASFVIKGDGTYGTLSITGEGNTFKFASGTTQEITGTFTCTGTLANNNILTNNGGTDKWNLDVSKNNAAFEYTKISYANSVNTIYKDWNPFYVTEGVSGSTLNIFQKAFYWYGASSSLWTDSGNWCYEENQTSLGAAPDNNGSSTVIIVDTSSYYPILSAAVNVKSLTVNENTKIDFATYDVTANSITNNGQVILAGNQSINGVITNGTDSKVEYTDECSNEPMGTSYAYLIFSDGANTTIGTFNASTVSKDLNIDNGNQTLKLSISTVNGNINIGTSTTRAGNITLISNDTLNFNDVYCNSLAVTSTIALNGNIDATDSVTFNSMFTINTDVTVDASLFKVASLYGGDGKSLNVNCDFTASGVIQNIADLSVTGIFTDSSNIQNIASLTVNGITNFSGSSISTTGSQSYNDVFNYSGSNNTLSLLTSASTITTNGLESTGTKNLNIQDSNFIENGTISGFQDVIINQILSNDLSVEISNATGINNWIFNGTADNNISFNADSSLTINNFTVNKNGTLSLENDFNQSSGSTFTVTTGTVNIGTTIFKASELNVASGAQFIQTGDNGTNEQSCAAITNAGNIIWDSGENGGTLLIKGNVTGENIAYNHKNVIFDNNISISGIFWDLTINPGVTLINSREIVVRRNLTVEDTGNYIHSGNPLILGSNNAAYPSATTGNFTDENSTKCNLGNVTVQASGITKTAVTDLQFNNLTLAAGTTLESDECLYLTGNFTDTGILQGDYNLTFNGSTTQTANVNPSTEYKTITFKGNMGLTIRGNIVVDNFIEESVSGAIDFKNSVEVKNDSLFNTTDTVLFGSSGTGNIINFTKDLVHTAGVTILFGNLTADGISLDVLQLQNSVEITSGNSILCSEISASTNNATINAVNSITCGDLTCNDLIVTAVNTILSGNLTCNDCWIHSNFETVTNPVIITARNISLYDDAAFDTNITVKNTGLFYLEDGKNISFNRSFTQDIDSTGDFMLGGSFTGNESALIRKDVYIFGNNAGNINFGADNNLVIENNLFIAAAQNRTVNIHHNVTAKNILLYSGKLNVQNSLASTQDIILLGPSYSEKDTLTTIDGEYKYNQTRSNGASPNLTFAAYSKFPLHHLENGSTNQGGDLLPGVLAPKGSATFGNAANLSAGNNLYINGIPLSSTTNGQTWYIDIPRNDGNGSTFAEAYFTNVKDCTVRCKNNNSDDGSIAQIPAEECTDNGNNKNWDFANLEITDAYTVRDNILYVEFNKPVRNVNGELINLISQFKLNDNGTEKPYYKAYKDIDCQTEIVSGQNIEKIDGKVFVYLYSTIPWNTDATGTSAGTASSTDRNGNHKNVIPYIKLSRATADHHWCIQDKFGKRSKHYVDTNKYTLVGDKTGPVLVSVRTGQEAHTPYPGSASTNPQKKYDAHNFIEFKYSEPVDFDTDITNGAENIQVRDDFGIITENVNSSYNGPLTFAGLGTVENGNVYTKTANSDDKYVNSLYRKDVYSIRISIAGYVNGSVNNKHKWTGYIEKAVLPSGNITLPVNSSLRTNSKIKDFAGNAQEYLAYKQDLSPVTENTLSVNSGTSASDSTYGKWDIYAPEIVKYHSPGHSTEDSNYEVNAFGAATTVDHLEVHIVDNYSGFQIEGSSDKYTWISSLGWCTTQDGYLTTNVLSLISGGEAADVCGGSRPFTAGKTGGGIRYCTYYNQYDKFSYKVVTDGVPGAEKPFTNITFGASRDMYVGNTANNNEIKDDVDNLYFSLTIQSEDISANYEFAQEFEFSYCGQTDDSVYNTSFITDLAGNRLGKAEYKSSIDRTPPNFDIVVTPVGSNKMYILFIKELRLNNNIIYEGSNIPESFEEIIPYCFEIGKITGSSWQNSSDLQIDTSVHAKYLKNQSNSEFTGIELTLNRNVTLDDVENLYIRLKNAGTVNGNTYEESSKDINTGVLGSKVTFIQDNQKNYMRMYTAHAISDFAVNVVLPDYAYNTDYVDEQGNLIQEGLYETDSFAVHSWGKDQGNFGTLRANHPILLNVQVTDGNDNTNIPPLIKMYISNRPDSYSVSTQYNLDIGANKRIWFPDAFENISKIANTNYSVLNGVRNDAADITKGLYFDIPESIYSTWSAGNQVSFIFKLMNSETEDIQINSVPYLIDKNNYDLSSSTKRNLFALRLENSDPTSFDLWSFKLKDIALQRGGVSILNNVIDPTNLEKTVLKLNMPTEGRVNIMVMTLDGSIITYLNKDNLSAGEHIFTWDGRNGKGTPVARGIYFIRVVGNGMDETRKVMVIKK